MIYLLIAASLVVGLSLFVEFALHLPPCTLCKVQRGIYLSIIPIAIAGLVFSDRQRLQRGIRIGCIVLLSLSAITASYHTLVQMGFLKDRCKPNLAIGDTDSFRALLTTPKKGCSEDGWKLGKIPAPALNLLLSVVLLISHRLGRI